LFVPSQRDSGNNSGDSPDRTERAETFSPAPDKGTDWRLDRKSDEFFEDNPCRCTRLETEQPLGDTEMADQGEIKAAEQRGYAKGYAAGKRRRHEEEGDNAEFWQQAFLTVLPRLLNGHTWEMDGKKVVTMEERVELARRAANAAVTAAALQK
jgi:hypothetical protein